jgi:predicted MFS family arabinose efflux permease
MHKITLPDGSRVNDPWLRWLRTGAYLCMGLSGMFLLISPILSDIYSSTAEVMAWFLLVGGFVCAFGCATERWWGEYIGAPLLMSSFAVFAFITFIGSFPAYPYIATGNLLLLSAVVLGLAARWRHARTIYRLAVHLSEKPSIEPDGKKS